MFVGLIIGNSFKGLLRDQIINPPKWWYHSIEEINKKNLGYLSKIFIPRNSLTYFTLKRSSGFDPKLRKLMKLGQINVEDDLQYIIGFKFTNFFFRNHNRAKCHKALITAFLPSNYWQTIEILGGNHVVTHDMSFDHVHNVRFIRKHFKFSHQMVLL